MRDKLRDLLSPHFGHLDFLMKIHKEEISYEDMSLLVDLIKDKSLIQYLHKDLHSYNSYYLLMVELHFIKDNLKYIKFFKELTKGPRDIFLDILRNRTLFKRIRSKIDNIIEDEELTQSFRRWSSRIKDQSYAITYVDLLKNKNNLDEIFNSTEKIVELKDYETVSRYLPTAWCITNRETFYRYLRSQRIFLMKLNGKVYGINVDSYLGSDYTVNSIYDDRNNQVYDDIIRDIAQTTISKLALNKDIIVEDKDFSKTNRRVPVTKTKKNPFSVIKKAFKRFMNILLDAWNGY